VKHILANHKDLKITSAVTELAKVRLRDVFGMELVEVPHVTVNKDGRTISTSVRLSYLILGKTATGTYIVKSKYSKQLVELLGDYQSPVEKLERLVLMTTISLIEINTGSYELGKQCVSSFLLI
jgi:hypothetical protein